MCTLGRGWLFDQSPVEATATEFAMSFSGRQLFIRIALTHCWGIMHVLWDSMGEDFWKFALFFLQTLTHRPFLFVDLSLLISVMNQSLNYDYMLRLTSSSSKSLNLGEDVLGTLTHTHNPI